MFVAMTVGRARLLATAKVMPVGLKVADTKQMVTKSQRIITVLFQVSQFSLYRSLAVEVRQDIDLCLREQQFDNEECYALHDCVEQSEEAKY